jgi:hypothetical protein
MIAAYQSISIKQKYFFLKGFHFFVDAFNGFGGLNADLLGIINEEYAKRPVLTIFSFPQNKNHVNIDGIVVFYGIAIFQSDLL